MITLLIIETLTLAVFLVLDVIAFYVTFEAVLIPLFLLVGI
jgi:NADH:ubiquinone oxidoreductase subunit 4 (subunit M)